MVNISAINKSFAEEKKTTVVPVHRGNPSHTAAVSPNTVVVPTIAQEDEPQKVEKTKGRDKVDPSSPAIYF